MEYGGRRRGHANGRSCAWLPRGEEAHEFWLGFDLLGPRYCRDTKDKQRTDEPGDGKVGVEVEVLVQSHSRRCASSPCRRRPLPCRYYLSSSSLAITTASLTSDFW